MTPYNEFKNMVLGRGFDMDGAYGNQCWDGYAKYCQYLGYPACYCTTSGYVKDIANNRRSNGLLNNFIDVGLNAALQPGDVCVWGNCPDTPYSHIAIYDSDSGQNHVRFLGQNQGGYNGAFDVREIPVSGIIGVFRPKCFTGNQQPKPVYGENVMNGIPDDFVKEKATFTVAVDEIRIREAPSLSGKDTGLVYKKGMSVNYDGYVRRQNYVWISWIGASGTRRWMAAGELNSAGANVKPYGTFR